MVRPSPVNQIFHLIFYLRPLFQCHGAWSIGMIVYHPFRVHHPERASNFELSRLRVGKLRMAPENAHNFPESQPQTRLLTQTLQTVKRHDQSTRKDLVY